MTGLSGCLSPPDEARPASARNPRGHPGGHRAGHPPNILSAIREAVREVIRPLSEQLEAANRRADDERARADRERERADQAERRVTELLAEQRAMPSRRSWWPWGGAHDPRCSGFPGRGFPSKWPGWNLSRRSPAWSTASSAPAKLKCNLRSVASRRSVPRLPGSRTAFRVAPGLSMPDGLYLQFNSCAKLHDAWRRDQEIVRRADRVTGKKGKDLLLPR